MFFSTKDRMGLVIRTTSRTLFKSNGVRKRWLHLGAGRKFRRQHSINNFIVDFYCASEQLIIELDGQAHLNPTAEENDRRRDRILEGMGFKVLRFENKMVFENLESVLKEIRDNFRG